uniref:magnesium chelatase n=1 Tax=Nannochloropsis oculata TaxID=43925 RepID=T1RJ86_9STRA|nr:magnesium-chelatase subunit [Nannochloropsis oculata]AGI99024.1 magnesium-chelatase subunit [Nannochloropsis oculata]AHX25445.1 magnesium chelatase subunit [Nannochloropsis oculata]
MTQERRRWGQSRLVIPPNQLGRLEQMDETGLINKEFQKSISNISNQSKTKKARASFPFLAIQGQNDLKLGMILNVIEPDIKGILIIGDRGTGKSTTIRAFANLLPDILVVKGDPYNRAPISIRKTVPFQATKENQENLVHRVHSSYLRIQSDRIEVKTMPLVDLPLGATEDRICGSINLERAVTEGEKAFEPGLLAKANRGLLYVDEVNLLDDHLVDILLDASASGYTVVEREGVSVRHPSKFILIGSGNPEEGEVRPQLLDRFGLYTEIKTVEQPLMRVHIIDSRVDYDDSDNVWRNNYWAQEEYLKEKIERAQFLYKCVKLPESLKQAASRMCSALNVDGLRADLVICRAAKALAAFNEEDTVTIEHFKRVSQLCLRHRLRKDPLELIDSGRRVDDLFTISFEESELVS